MTLVQFSHASKIRHGYVWLAAGFPEAIGAACSMALIAFGPFSLSHRPLLWVAGAGVFLLAYLSMALWATYSILSGGSHDPGRQRALLAASTLPFLAGFLLELALLLFRPTSGGWVWNLLSPMQPFPTIAMAIGLLVVFLAKTVAVSLALPRRSAAAARALGFSADVALPVALLLIGVLQASVYLIPIGNAFLRFWAIADWNPSETGYPVTVTEPGPVAAGSPPYVYDLVLFPLLLRAAFALLGHNSAAAYLPSVISNALFPLSLYLVIREGTGSRVVSLVFAVLASLFPYLRFWVLNLPDPDPFLLTSACFAAYLYLRALAAPDRSLRWVAAGVAAGVLSLARPEGILYAGFLGLGALAHRPGIKQIALYGLFAAIFVAPMVGIWIINFGFIWPQNYNRTLGMEYPLKNYEILRGNDALGFYHRGLGLSGECAVALLALFCLSVLFGTLAMAIRREGRRLLAIAIPGIGNTITIFFANPYIPNTFHFADFFRHASFGIPFLVVASAYGFHVLYRYLASRPRLRGVAYLCLILLVAAVIRESDILANPTATHRPGATQVLTTFTYLSMQAILEHPMPLPTMTYRSEGGVTIAYPTFMAWPEDAFEFFKPFDMSFDAHGRPFGYGSAAAFVVALCFAVLAELRLEAEETRGFTATIEKGALHA